jgi:hypothetical protein
MIAIYITNNIGSIRTVIPSANFIFKIFFIFVTTDSWLYVLEIFNWNSSQNLVLKI